MFESRLKLKRTDVFTRSWPPSTVSRAGTKSGVRSALRRRKARV